MKIRSWLSVLGVAAMMPLQAQALPALQLYINDFNTDADNYSYFDGTDETWVRVGQSNENWQLNIIANGKANGKDILAWTDLRIVASWMGSNAYAPALTGVTFSGRYGGSFFTGDTNATNWTNGLVPLPAIYNDATNANTGDDVIGDNHAPYGTNTAWAEFLAGSAGPGGTQTICDYQDPISSCNGTGWIVPLTLTTSGLPEGVFVHFDAWGIGEYETTVQSESQSCVPKMVGNPPHPKLDRNGNPVYKCTTIINTSTDTAYSAYNAPNSHDARWEQGGPDVEVPAPGALALIGFGLIGLGFRRRK